MIRSAASKVMWVGRATVFMVGLAVILALVFGLASVAFAGNGDPWRLGQGNVATAITALGGSSGVDGAMVRLTNNNSGTNDTALDLRVQSGEAPMRVNRDTLVANLNADRLDGRNSAGFLSSEIYTVEVSRTTQANTLATGGINCDDGDLAISGGFTTVDSTSQVAGSSRGSAAKLWVVTVRTGSTEDEYIVQAVCADLPPLRP